MKHTTGPSMWDFIKLSIIISDNRFAPFFTGDYFNEVTTNGIKATYKKDTNYDMIMEEILTNSTMVSKRWFCKHVYRLDQLFCGYFIRMICFS